MVRIFAVAAVLASVVAAKKQFPVMSSSGDNACYIPNKATTYRGMKDSGVDGEKCMRWVQPNKDDKDLSGSPGFGNHSFCRSDADGEAPFCYAAHNGLKQDCGVPECKKDGHFARDFNLEHQVLSTEVEAKDCECADQLYGSTTTTANTRVSFLQKPCKCGN